MRSLFVFVPAVFALCGCTRGANPANDVDIANAADAARESVDNYAALPPSAKSRAVVAKPPAPPPTQ